MGEFVAQQIVNCLAIGSIYALIALGFTMVFGVLQMINFAHSDLFMVGAFAAMGLAAYAIGPTGSLAVALGIALILIVVAIGVGFLGLTIERLAYRPLRHTSRLGPLLSSLGVSVVLQNIVMLLAGPQPIAFPHLLPSISFSVAGARITAIQIAILALSGILLFGMLRFIHGTRLGIQIRAVAENRQAALLLGINIDLIIAAIFFLGAAMGAVAGILYAAYYGVIHFAMGLIVGLKAFTAAILGGIGSIPGAVLGAYLLAFLEVFGSGVLPIVTNGAIGPEYRDIFAFSALIVVLIFRPAGLLGQRVSEETLVYKRDF